MRPVEPGRSPGVCFATGGLRRYGLGVFSGGSGFFSEKNTIPVFSLGSKMDGKLLKFDVIKAGLGSFGVLAR